MQFSASEVLRIQPTGDALYVDVPEAAHDVSLKGKLRDIGSAAASDLETTDERKQALVAGAGFMAVKAVGAAQLPSTLTPIVAMGVLEKTGSAPLVGLSTAAVYGAWTLVGTRALNFGMDRFPATLQCMNQSFPQTVRHMSGALNIDEQAPVNAVHEKRQLSASQLGRFALRNVQRSITSYVAGGARLMAAGIEGRSPAERRRMANVITADGAVLAGIVATGVAQTIVTIGEKHPALAHQIQHNMKSPLVWYGLAGVVMVRQWWKNTGGLAIRDRWERWHGSQGAVEPQSAPAAQVDVMELAAPKI